MEQKKIEKILNRLTSKNNRHSQAFSQSNDQIDAAQNSQFIHKFGPITARTIPYFIILSIILATILAIFKIQFTSTLPAIIIPITLPTISLSLGILSNRKWQKENNVKENIKKYVTAKTNTEKIIQEVQYKIAADKNHMRDTIYAIAINKLNDADYKPPYITPSTLSEARRKLTELQTKLKTSLDKLDTLNTHDILHHQFIGAVDEFSCTINNIINTLLIGGISIIYSITMILLFDKFFPTLMATSNIPFLTFTGIAALGGIAANSIVNKINQDEIEAFNQINQTLDKSLDIQEYELEDELVQQMIQTKLKEISDLILQIEYQKINIAELETKNKEENNSPTTVDRFLDYGYKFNPLASQIPNKNPRQKVQIDPEEIEIIGPKKTRKKI